jgi:hypothetical protein
VRCININSTWGNVLVYLAPCFQTQGIFSFYGLQITFKMTFFQEWTPETDVQIKLICSVHDCFAMIP